MATYIRTDSQTDVQLYEHLLVMVAYMFMPVNCRWQVPGLASRLASFNFQVLSLQETNLFLLHADVAARVSLFLNLFNDVFFQLHKLKSLLK